MNLNEATTHTPSEQETRQIKSTWRQLCKTLTLYHIYYLFDSDITLKIDLWHHLRLVTNVNLPFAKIKFAIPAVSFKSTLKTPLSCNKTNFILFYFISYFILFHFISFYLILFYLYSFSFYLILFFISLFYPLIQLNHIFVS